MALLLLGPRHAVVVAVAGAWTQCTFKVKQPYPAVSHRVQHGRRGHHDGGDRIAYVWLGGSPGPLDVRAARQTAGRRHRHLLRRQHRSRRRRHRARRPSRRAWQVWRDDFLWSGASFMVAGSAGRRRGRRHRSAASTGRRC